MKKSNRIIIGVIALLVILVGILAVISLQGLNSDKDKLQVITDAGSAEYTLEAIKDMPSVEVEKEIISSSRENEEGIFKGVSIEDIISESDKNWAENYSEIVLTAADGYSSIIMVDEVLDENVIIVYAKDGEPLSEETGPLRAVIVDDPFGNRSTFQLNKIELK